MKLYRILRNLARVDLVDAVMALAGATVPTRDFRAVTPHDVNPIPGGPARALYIGSAGDVAAVNEAGATVVFTNVPAGSVLPIEVAIVKEESTTATGIIAL